jgi:hypothetical protein
MNRVGLGIKPMVQKKKVSFGLTVAIHPSTQPAFIEYESLWFRLARY